MQTSLAEGVMTAQACLTELDLSDNAFGPVGVEALVGFLTSSSCFTLKVARFNNNGLGIKGGTVSSLKHNSYYTFGIFKQP